MQFVVWPSDVFGSDGKFHLCVVGADNFGSALSALETEQIDGRQIALRRLEQAAQARDLRCHMLFIARNTPDAPATDIPQKRGLLVIGETSGFLNRGGMINLIEVDRRIRFEINQRAATDAGLQISSRLLHLAVRR
jgi:hypothetical protein